MLKKFKFESGQVSFQNRFLHSTQYVMSNTYYQLYNNEFGTYAAPSDPFVCLHSVNAYEKRDKIILDLVCYNQGNPYDDLYLKNLQSENFHLPHATLRRYLLNLSEKNVATQRFHPIIMNFLVSIIN